MSKAKKTFTSTLKPSARNISANFATTASASATPTKGGSLTVGIPVETPGFNPSTDEWDDTGNLEGSTMLEPLATAGADVVRDSLCDEAIRLARLVTRLMSDEPEAGGLLALMLLTHSRRDQRQSGDGRLRTLRDQDRSRWDQAAITEGRQLLEAALLHHQPGRYQVEAAIAAVHSEAITADSTDWAQIAALYATLRELAPSPIAAPTRLVELARTSPIANTPGMLVSKGSGARPPASIENLPPVTTKPLLSTVTQFCSH